VSQRRGIALDGVPEPEPEPVYQALQPQPRAGPFQSEPLAFIVSGAYYTVAEVWGGGGGSGSVNGVVVQNDPWNLPSGGAGGAGGVGCSSGSLTLDEVQRLVQSLPPPPPLFRELIEVTTHNDSERQFVVGIQTAGHD
jgi:hypothetical protein